MAVISTLVHHARDSVDTSATELDKGPHNSATTTALLVLATVFVGLRFWARYLRSAQFAADDWLIIAALVMTFVAGSLNYAMIANGLGKHADVVPFPTLIEFFKLLLGFECIYVTAVMLVKLSVLKMYMRIFPLKGFQVGGYIIGGTVVAWWIAIVLVCIFQCDPIAKAWNPTLPGHCIDLKASFIGNAIPNIVTDVAILSMPIGQVWTLHVNVMQKISLLFMFLLGSFVLFASIYRFTTIMQFDVADTTWTLAVACTWCVVEAACGVIGACLPTLRPIMNMISTQFSSIQSRNRTRNTTRGGNKSSTGFGSAALVTIGGSNATPRAHGFSKMDSDGFHGHSADELPLQQNAGGIQIQSDYSVHHSAASEHSKEYR